MDLERQVFEKVKREIEGRIRKARCPDHPGPLRATASGPSLRSLKRRIEACCEKGKEAVERAIRGG